MVDITALNLIDTIERSRIVTRRKMEMAQLTIEEQAKLSVTAATKGTRNHLPTPIENKIEDALNLVDFNHLKSFSQDLSDLKEGLNFLDMIITEMRKIQNRR